MARIKKEKKPRTNWKARLVEQVKATDYFRDKAAEGHREIKRLMMEREVKTTLINRLVLEQKVWVKEKELLKYCVSIIEFYSRKEG